MKHSELSFGAGQEHRKASPYFTGNVPLAYPVKVYNGINHEQCVPYPWLEDNLMKCLFSRAPILPDPGRTGENHTKGNAALPVYIWQRESTSPGQPPLKTMHIWNRE